MAKCLVGLGSNLGDRAATLERALSLLDAVPDLRLRARSDLIETRPVGGPPGQADFLNAAAVIETSLEPEPLLRHLQQIESDLHRERRDRWGPRSIDLDLLLFDQRIIDTPQLILPHPRMAFRRFVLQPATQIVPDWIHPPTQFTLRELLHRLDTKPIRIAIVGDIQRSVSEQFHFDPALCCVEHIEPIEHELVVAPHLVVWLDDNLDLPGRERLAESLYRARQFPVLRLQSMDRQRAMAEISGAISAMVPSP